MSLRPADRAFPHPHGVGVPSTCTPYNDFRVLYLSQHSRLTTAAIITDLTKWMNFFYFLRGIYAVIFFSLLFSMIQFRDGPFIRPHPAFWRVVLGINLLYELALVFLLFQDVRTARQMMTYLDPNLGVPLPEKSYAENCAFTPRNVWVRMVLQFMVVQCLSKPSSPDT